MGDFWVITIAVAAWIGGLVSGLVGFWKSGEKFDWKKFGCTALTALIAGAAFAIGYKLAGQTVSWLDIAIAFVAGAGADTLVNRIGKTASPTGPPA